MKKHKEKCFPHLSSKLKIDNEENLGTITKG